MSNFNLDNYETVKSRKQRFYTDHKDGRICVELVNTDLDEKAVVKAFIFLTSEDQKNNLPRGMGYALEIRDKNLSKSQYGKEYESVNYSSWLENCEESAVGRGLDNAGYASNGKCSRDEIEKAQRNTAAIKSLSTQTTPITKTYDFKESAVTSLDSDYVIPFGNNSVKGKKISECSVKDLQDSYSYWTTSPTVKKPLSAKMQEMVTIMEKFLAVPDAVEQPSENFFD